MRVSRAFPRKGLLLIAACSKQRAKLTWDNEATSRAP